MSWEEKLIRGVEHVDHRARKTDLSAAASTASQATRPYDGVTRFLHWLMAAQIVIQFGLTLIWNRVGEDFGHQLVRLHVSLGVCLCVTLIARILWRGLGGRPPVAAPSSPSAGLAHAVHRLLYVMMLIELAAGLSKRWARGRMVDVFGVLHIPSPFAYAPDLRPIISFTHEWLAWAIILVACGHALVALFHHFVLKDAVLKRMIG